MKRWNVRIFKDVSAVIRGVYKNACICRQSPGKVEMCISVKDVSAVIGRVCKNACIRKQSPWKVKMYVFFEDVSAVIRRVNKNACIRRQSPGKVEMYMFLKDVSAVISRVYKNTCIRRQSPWKLQMCIFFDDVYAVNSRVGCTLYFLRAYIYFCSAWATSPMTRTGSKLIGWSKNWKKQKQTEIPVAIDKKKTTCGNVSLKWLLKGEH